MFFFIDTNYHELPMNYLMNYLLSTSCAAAVSAIRIVLREKEKDSRLGW